MHDKGAVVRINKDARLVLALAQRQWLTQEPTVHEAKRRKGYVHCAGMSVAMHVHVSVYTSGCGSATSITGIVPKGNIPHSSTNFVPR